MLAAQRMRLKLLEVNRVAKYKLNADRKIYIDKTILSMDKVVATLNECDEIKSINIGRYKIFIDHNILKNEPSIWISVQQGIGAGEGMAVSVSKFEEAIDEFYSKNFWGVKWK